MSERFRLALVGAGRMGRTHARALAASSEVEIACVVEPFDEAAALVDAPRATLDDLPEVDGALVCVPTRLHVEVVTALSSLGLPVLCEKPCGLTTDETRAIAALPTRLQVAYWRRFVPALRYLRERIAAGELGEVAIVRCAQWDEFPPSREFRNPASSGGIVVDMGVHEFDQMRWLTGQEVGRVTGVAAVTATEPVEGDPESVDLAVALSGGAVGNVSLTRRTCPARRCTSTCSAPTGRSPSTSSRRREATRRSPPRFGHRPRTSRAAGGQGATVADALAALDAAERGRAALDFIAGVRFCEPQNWAPPPLQAAKNRLSQALYAPPWCSPSDRVLTGRGRQLAHRIHRRVHRRGHADRLGVGAVGYGFASGAVVGIPAGVAATVVKYRA